MFSSNTSGHGHTTRNRRNAAASTSASEILHGSPTSAQRTPRAAVAAAAQAPSASRAARDRALLAGQYTPGSSTAGAGTGVRPLGTPATAAVRRSVGQLVHSPATTRLEQRRLRGKQHWRASLTGREPEDARRFSARCDAVRKSASTALTALLAVGTDAGGNELGQIALDEEARKDYNVFKSALLDLCFRLTRLAHTLLRSRHQGRVPRQRRLPRSFCAAYGRPARSLGPSVIVPHRRAPRQPHDLSASRAQLGSRCRNGTDRPPELRQIAARGPGLVATSNAGSRTGDDTLDRPSHQYQTTGMCAAVGGDGAAIC